MDLSFFYNRGIQTIILILVFVLIRLFLIYMTRRYANKFDRLEHRTGLIIKHINYAVLFTIALGLIFIWGVDYNDVSSLLLSVFAVIGIGFFAQWSILSNITSGVIMFFIFPYKIGDYIKVHDKEHDYQGTIEDIKTFHIIIRSQKGEMITYPNSLILQKGVSVIKPEDIEMVDEFFSPSETTPTENENKTE